MTPGEAPKVTAWLWWSEATTAEPGATHPSLAWGILPQPPIQAPVKEKGWARTLPESRQVISGLNLSLSVVCRLWETRAHPGLMRPDPAGPTDRLLSAQN